MIQTGIYADFIVVDGGEGGTGAAPLEFSDSLGAPLARACWSSRTRSSGPASATGSRSAPAARWSPPRRWRGRWRSAPTGATPPGRSCSRSAASSRSAATPTSARSGVTTQDPKLQRALIVPGQGRAGAQLPPEHRARAGRDDRRDGAGPARASCVRTTSFRRVTQFQALTLDEIYDLVGPGELLEGTALPRFQRMLGRVLGRVVPHAARSGPGRSHPGPRRLSAGTSRTRPRRTGEVWALPRLDSGPSAHIR